MTAETGSGPPTPACWASMSMVSRAFGTIREGWGARWSPPWARHAGRVSRGWRLEAGRSSPGGPSGPGLSGRTGKDCLGRGRWVAALPEHQNVRPWAEGGHGEEAVLRLAAVLGVWPDGSDGTDINSLCRSHNERVVAVADDFCKVHLFQYPCARAKVRPGGLGCCGRAGGRAGGPGLGAAAAPSWFPPRRPASCTAATAAT